MVVTCNEKKDKLKHIDNVISHLSQWQKSKFLITSVVRLWLSGHCLNCRWVYELLTTLYGGQYSNFSQNYICIWSFTEKFHFGEFILQVHIYMCVK